MSGPSSRISFPKLAAKMASSSSPWRTSSRGLLPSFTPIAQGSPPGPADLAIWPSHGKKSQYANLWSIPHSCFVFDQFSPDVGRGQSFDSAFKDDRPLTNAPSHGNLKSF